LAFDKSLAAVVIIWTECLACRIADGTAKSGTNGPPKLSTADRTTNGSDAWCHRCSTSTTHQTAAQIAKPATEEAATRGAGRDAPLVRFQAKGIINTDWIV
jgi:hypothetical protein